MAAVFAKVVDVHPESVAVDCVVSADNRQLRFVPVISSALSGNTGRVDLPVPELVTAEGVKILRTSSTWETDKWASVNSKTRDILAVIDFVGGAPVCYGFIAPPVCQLKMPSELGLERRVDRHASDVYEWIDALGNTQWRHPNGTHSSLANNPVFKDLAAKDWDKKWLIKRNVASVLSYFFSLINNSTRHFAVKINPFGKTAVSSTDTIKLTATGAVGNWPAFSDDPDAELSLFQASQTADLFGKNTVSLRTPSGTQVMIKNSGEVVITGNTSVTITAPKTTVTGTLTVKGMVTALSGITMGPNATMTGPNGGAVQGGLWVTGQLQSDAPDNQHHHLDALPPF